MSVFIRKHDLTLQTCQGLQTVIPGYLANSPPGDTCERSTALSTPFVAIETYPRSVKRRRVRAERGLLLVNIRIGPFAQINPVALVVRHAVSFCEQPDMSRYAAHLQISGKGYAETAAFGEPHFRAAKAPFRAWGLLLSRFVPGHSTMKPA